MKDQYKRSIDYLRISVTDRCNLRCQYCMPDGIECTTHQDILRYEEILTICKAAGKLGISRFKITGGEPLVRKGIVDFIRCLKSMDGVEDVTLTTNGVLLESMIDDLKTAGIDAINISLDTLNRKKYAEITGFDVLPQVIRGIRASEAAGIKTKLNCVLLNGSNQENNVELSHMNSSLIQIVDEFARNTEIDIRFIELMPIGVGKTSEGISQDIAREILLTAYPDLHSISEKRGNGPAHYEASQSLKGRIGWIDAVSHTFCESCNRIRLTSTGLLKPCLCYGEGADLKNVLRSGDFLEEDLLKIMYEIIYNKPQAHCFSDKNHISEERKMVEIGG